MRPASHSRRVLVLLVAVAVVVAAIGAWAWWRSGPGTPLARAVATAPADSQRLTFTDWAAVRRELGVDVGSGSTQSELRDFLDAAFSEDLSAMSALVGSAPTLHRSLGLSPATLSWEALAQGADGAVVTMAVVDEVDLDDLGDRMAELGWQRPEDDDGVWTGGADVLSRLGPDLTPQLQHLALDRDAGLVRASDSAKHLRTVLDSDDLGELDDGVDQVVTRLTDDEAGTPLAAAVMAGDHACRALAMAGADEDDELLADSLVAAAGEVDPFTGFGMAALTGDRVRVALSFGDDESAVANAESRAVLAAGEAPGQGGSFPDRFAVDEVTARGEVVVMDLVPEPGAYVLSDLTSGPVLFATC